MGLRDMIIGFSLPRAAAAAAAAALLVLVAVMSLSGQARGVKEAIGELKKVTSDKQLIVKVFDKEDLVLTITEETKVSRNKNESKPDFLEPGDVVSVEYDRGILGGYRAIKVAATSPFFKGRLVDINLRHQEITIKGGFSARVFKVSSQTVILRKNSLMLFEDLERGLLVRAEFSGIDHPELDELRVLE